MIRSLVLVLIFSVLHAAVSEQQLTAEELMKKADAFLAEGKYDEALSHYSDAVNRDSSNYQYFWKRAVLYLQKQRYREALADLNQVLSLNPTSAPALMRRAKIYKDMGKFSEAKTDLQEFIKLRPDDKEANKLNDLVTKTDGFLTAGERLFESNNFRAAIDQLTQALTLAPGIENARLLRARSYFKLGEYNPVIEDTMAILRARKNNIEALYIRAKAFLYLGEIDTALNHLRECIRVDPDYKACTQESKKLRSFQKSLQAAEDAVNGGNGAAALESLKSCLEYDPNWHFIMPKLYILKCKSHNKAKDPKSALEACSKALEYDAGLIEAVIQMGEALLLSEEWDRAVAEMQRAVEMDQGNQQAREGLGRAQRLLKMSKRKDYYKILGVARTATDRDIKKSFRKLALQWHPDKHPVDKKDEVEKMFRDISEANEVLSDPVKKQKYDNGEDLEEQPQQQGNPFGFGFPGGFQFHFQRGG